MDSSEKQESFTYTFLKPRHFEKKSENTDESKLTSKEIGKKLQEKNIEPELFDIIEKVISLLFFFSMNVVILGSESNFIEH